MTKKPPAKKPAAKANKAKAKAKPKPKAKAKPATKKPAAKPKAPDVEDVESVENGVSAESADVDRGDESTAEDPEFAPARLEALEKGGYAISFDIGAFDDKLDVQEAFSEIGEGNGYEWEAILAPALEKRDPKAFSAVDWSPEADTFVASSSDKSSLAVLASVLRDIVKDQASLEQAVKNHDPERT
jgi:hypothetical protein